MEYSGICYHDRLKRINKNFVRCLKCGETIINHETIIKNKSSRDFVNENNSFIRNFDRNFSNIIEQVDEENDKPYYEYYIDRNRVNKIIVNRKVQFNSNPATYETIINGKKYYIDDNKIQNILNQINALKVDADMFKKLIS